MVTYYYISFTLVADELKEIRLELNHLNRKNGHLELKNARQDGEIRFLKRALSNIVNGEPNNDQMIKPSMQKRAARLLPLQLLMLTYLKKIYFVYLLGQ